MDRLWRVLSGWDMLIKDLNRSIFIGRKAGKDWLWQVNQE